MANWDPNVYGQYPEISEGMASSGQGTWGPLLPNETYLYNGKFVKWEPSTGALIDTRTANVVLPGTGSGDGGGTAPLPSPTASTFGLPEFPLTAPAGNWNPRETGLYSNLFDQIWASGNARDPNAQTFARWNFGGQDNGPTTSPVVPWGPGAPRTFPDNGIPPQRTPITDPQRQYGPPPVPNPRADGRVPGLLGGGNGLPATPPASPPPAAPGGLLDGRGSGYMPPARGDAYTGRQTGAYPGGRVDGGAGMGLLTPGYGAPVAPSPPAPVPNTKPLDLKSGRQTVSTLPQTDAGYRLPSANVANVQGAKDWGDWTNFTFQNPTESWMTQWNALDPALRPYYAAASREFSNPGQYQGAGTGLRSIYAALQAQNPSLYEQARYETNQAFGQQGYSPWRLDAQGNLQQNQGGTWATIANLAPGAYVPSLTSESAAYKGWLAAQK